MIEYLRREHSMSVMAYVDDFVLAAPSERISEHLSIVMHTLDALGLQVNVEKSSLEPSDHISYLGFDIRCASADRPPAITVPKGGRTLCHSAR